MYHLQTTNRLIPHHLDHSDIHFESELEFVIYSIVVFDLHHNGINHPTLPSKYRAKVVSGSKTKRKKIQPIAHKNSTFSIRGAIAVRVNYFS
jgi:hypothetical protein